MFIAFEYNYSPSSRPGLPQHQQRRQPRQPETIIPRPPASTTLFNVEGSSDDEVGQTIKNPSSGRKVPQQRGPRTVPLSPYLDPEYDEMTPTSGSSRGKVPPMATKSRQPALAEESEDDLDPFRRSTIDDEEAQIRALPRPAVTSAGARIRHADIVQGQGHQRSVSGGAGGGLQIEQPSPPGLGQKRMMTSTQELNMKSQFLMNMRPYGTDSQASQGSDMELDASASRLGSGSGSALRSQAYLGGSSVQGPTGSQSQPHGDGGDESLSEGEESQLGPGSDFFK